MDFEREDYTGGAWKASGEVKTYTIPFKVTAAPVTQYTITATSNGNGTINPQGNITAEQGKDYTFTFTPNNGYKVSKVYVDGYEVKAENNKYTFKAINANHTISVTFEQARKIDSPKTGDNMKTTPAIVLLVVSAALLLGVFVYGRKKNK
ncbi:MAG: InlB B-repeat-containing protein [Frisingicoccus sp.]